MQTFSSTKDFWGCWWLSWWLNPTSTLYCFIIPCTARVEEREVFAVYVAHVHWFVKSLYFKLQTTNRIIVWCESCHAVRMPHATPSATCDERHTPTAFEFPHPSSGPSKACLAVEELFVLASFQFHLVGAIKQYNNIFLASGTLHAGRASFFSL